MQERTTSDAPDRIAVQTALGIIGDFTRDGLPLVVWEIHPHPGKADLIGHASAVRGGETAADVRDTVQEYAEWFGVRTWERHGREQDSIRAVTEIRGVGVEIWGIVARHGEVEQ